MRTLILTASLLLPAQALADCVYTGAKRPYLECIYAEAVSASAGVVDAMLSIGDLDLRVSTLEDLYVLLSDDLTTVSDALGDLETWVTGIDSDLTALSSDVAQLDADVTALSGSGGVVPVGTIVAWHKSLAGTPSLPTGWAECNGQTLSDAASPYNGLALPDLNGGARFLRGSATSGTMQNATRVAVTMETNASALFFDASGRNMTAYNNDFDATDVLSTSQRGSIARTGLDNAPGQIYAGRVRPANMSVVWIMRVK
ncbi:MAG TPA: tail fiber protein [Myxococcota bacterium]|nr:tail fiber protein [Myxococcota bacterium]